MDMYRLLRKFMSDHGFIMLPANELKENIVFGWVLLVDTQQLEDNIKLPNIVVKEDAGVLDVLQELKDNRKIMDFFQYTKAPTRFLEHLTVVDEYYFQVEGESDLYFVPYLCVGCKVGTSESA